MREARGSLFQRGVNDIFSLDQECPKYLCSKSIGPRESAGPCEWSLAAGKGIHGQMIEDEPLEGGEQRSLSFLLKHKGNPLRSFKKGRG